MTRKFLLLTAASTLVACSTDSSTTTKEAEVTPEPSRVREEVMAAQQNRMMAAGAYADMAFAPSPMITMPPVRDTSRFDNGVENPVFRVLENPVSTFSADVDTASYSVARRYLEMGQLPPSESVRVEEFINAFDYEYDLPESAEEPFRPDVTVLPSPWNSDAEIIRIGVKGYELEPVEAPSSNIVMLLDVSGSMNSADKLPLLIQSMEMLVDELDEDDTVSIVVYAGAAGMVLEPTPGDKKVKIKSALKKLEAGGSTAGGEGLALAYDLAEENFDPDAVNRVILATDGDFNVGVTGDDPLTDFVARKREEGIYLSVLGFGTGNYNDQMMQAIAQNGNGIAAYIDSAAEAEKILVREFTSSMFPIAEDLKFQVEFNPAAVAQYRLIGYQTRLLREEDFNNDAVDAGDIGSGHTVTALYEVVRRGEEGWLPDRRYDRLEEPAYDPDAELAYLKIRYKLPGEADSRLIDYAITDKDRVRRFADAPEDTRFAVLAAAFGQKLARDPHVEQMRLEDLIEMATDAKGRDEYGDRAGFVQMVRQAQRLSDS